MRNLEVDIAARALAADQYDCFALEQLRHIPGAGDVAMRRVRSGEWTQRARNVFGFGTRRSSWRMDLMVAHLQVWPESVVSHESAAALHGLDGYPEGALSLLVPHPFHRRVAGCVVHQTRKLPPSHLTRASGFPVTTLPRTFVDLAAVSRRSRLGHALEGAVIMKKVTLTEVGQAVLELTSPARRGLLTLTDLIQELGPGDPAPGSVMEAMFIEALRAAGEPLPRRQFPHPGRLPTPGCVDFAYPEACLICEIDGRRWHTRKQDIQRDHARDTAASLAGWETRRVLWEDLHDWPEDTIATLAAIRRQREAVIQALAEVAIR